MGIASALTITPTMAAGITNEISSVRSRPIPGRDDATSF